MTRHRSYSIVFKCQLSQEYLGDETLLGLAKRHGMSRNLMLVWTT